MHNVLLTFLLNINNLQVFKYITKIITYFSSRKFGEIPTSLLKLNVITNHMSSSTKYFYNLNLHPIKKLILFPLIRSNTSAN